MWKNPDIDPSAFIAPSADIYGDVSIAENCSIWFHATVRAGAGSVSIGAGTNNAVKYATSSIHVSLIPPCGMKEPGYFSIMVSNDVMEKITRRFHYMYLTSIITVIIYIVMYHFDFSGSPVLQAIQGACLGIGLGMLIVGAIFTSKYGNKIIAFKVQMLKHKS